MLPAFFFLFIKKVRVHLVDFDVDLPPLLRVTVLWLFPFIAAFTALATFLPDCRLQREIRRRMAGIWFFWCLFYWTLPFDIRSDWYDDSRLLFDDMIFLILAVQTSIVIWKGSTHVQQVHCCREGARTVRTLSRMNGGRHGATGHRDAASPRLIFLGDPSAVELSPR